MVFGQITIYIFLFLGKIILCNACYTTVTPENLTSHISRQLCGKYILKNGGLGHIPLASACKIHASEQTHYNSHLCPKCVKNAKVYALSTNVRNPVGFDFSPECNALPLILHIRNGCLVGDCDNSGNSDSVNSNSQNRNNSEIGETGDMDTHESENVQSGNGNGDENRTNHDTGGGRLDINEGEDREVNGENSNCDNSNFNPIRHTYRRTNMIHFKLKVPPPLSSTKYLFKNNPQPHGEKLP